MSKKEHVNPYRPGLYHDVFGYLKQKQVITRAEYVKYVMETLGKTEAEANAVVTLMLSPRKSSSRGDCRGNMSAQGHLYYIEKLARQVRAGVKEPQKFRLRWREVVLEPRNRIVKVDTVSEKTKVVDKVVDKAVVKSSEEVRVS